MERNAYRPVAIQNVWFSLLQFKIDVGLPTQLERDFFTPNMYMSMQNTYRCPHGWWIGLSIPDGV
jgi:hypothetical protein